MATKVTLDDIRNAAEARYGSYDITLSDGFNVSLLNVLRLSQEKRNKLKNLDDGMEEGNEDSTLKETIRTVAATPEQAERLLAEIGDDLAMLAVIVENYTSQTQAGEA